MTAAYRLICAGGVARRIALCILLLGTRPAGAFAPQGADIVVVAKKLRAWRAVLIVENDDIVRCRIVRSAGDATLDAQGCDAMKRCFETARPQLIAAEGGPASARRRRLAQINAAMQACFRSVKIRLDVHPPDE